MVRYGTVLPYQVVKFRPRRPSNSMGLEFSRRSKWRGGKECRSRSGGKQRFPEDASFARAFLAPCGTCLRFLVLFGGTERTGTPRSTKSCLPGECQTVPTVCTYALCRLCSGEERRAEGTALGPYSTSWRVPGPKITSTFSGLHQQTSSRGVCSGVPCGMVSYYRCTCICLLCALCVTCKHDWSSGAYHVRLSVCSAYSVDCHILSAAENSTTDSESVSFWLGAGADPNGLSNDQQSTALTAAVTHRQRGVIKVCFSLRGAGGRGGRGGSFCA